MENTRRRNRRKIQQQKRASGCCGAMALALALALCALILSISRGETPTGWTSSLEQNPYGPEDFDHIGGYLTCLSGSSRMGVDVSEYQGDIDWDKVREAGFEFAIVRIGFRGYTTGGIRVDDRAWANLEGARAAGLDVGVYFYAQAVSAEEAAEEARWCLDFLEGFELDLPVVYDWEYVSTSARTGGMDRATLTECTKTFCQIIEDAGYQPMVYFNPSVAETLLDLEELAQYPFWLAMYKDEMDYPYRVDIWQYTETGSVPGIEGDVDIDILFLY